MPTAEFAYGSTAGKMTRKLHDLTASSMGVLADVANGGLKKDLNSLAELQQTAALPATSDYATGGIYKQSFKTVITPDPSWRSC